MANDKNVGSYNIVQLILDVVMWWTSIQRIGDVFHPAYHTFYKPPTRWIKTHHNTASSITPHKLNYVIAPEIFIISPLNLYLYYLYNFNW